MFESERVGHDVHGVKSPFRQRVNGKHLQRRDVSMTLAIISMSIHKGEWANDTTSHGPRFSYLGLRRTKFGIRQGTQPDRTTTFLRLISYLRRIRPGALIGRLRRKWPAPIGF